MCSVFGLFFFANCGHNKKYNFAFYMQVWSHFDAGSCPGKAVGVNVRLENGILGFIPTRNISDKKVVHPEDRVKVS